MLPKIINLLAIRTKKLDIMVIPTAHIIYNQNKNCTQILINILEKSGFECRIYPASFTDIGHYSHSNGIDNASNPKRNKFRSIDFSSNN